MVAFIFKCFFKIAQVVVNTRINKCSFHFVVLVLFFNMSPWDSTVCYTVLTAWNILLSKVPLGVGCRKDTDC